MTELKVVVLDKAKERCEALAAALDVTGGQERFTIYFSADNRAFFQPSDPSWEVQPGTPFALIIAHNNDHFIEKASKRQLILRYTGGMPPTTDAAMGAYWIQRPIERGNEISPTEASEVLRWARNVLAGGGVTSLPTLLQLPSPNTVLPVLELLCEAYLTAYCDPETGQAEGKLDQATSGLCNYALATMGWNKLAGDKAGLGASSKVLLNPDKRKRLRNKVQAPAWWTRIIEPGSLMKDSGDDEHIKNLAGLLEKGKAIPPDTVARVYLALQAK